MNIEEFCEKMNQFVKGQMIASDSNIETFIIQNILNAENKDLKRVNPMHLCLAAQICEHLTSLKLMHMFHSMSISEKKENNENKKTMSYSEKLKEALWKCFKISAEEKKKSNESLRIAFVTEINASMRTSHASGLNLLNPIDISACLILTLYYTAPNKSDLDLFACTDKISHLKTDEMKEPDLNNIENWFQEVFNF